MEVKDVSGGNSKLLSIRQVIHKGKLCLAWSYVDYGDFEQIIVIRIDSNLYYNKEHMDANELERCRTAEEWIFRKDRLQYYETDYPLPENNDRYVGYYVGVGNIEIAPASGEKCFHVLSSKVLILKERLEGVSYRGKIFFTKKVRVFFPKISKELIHNLEMRYRIIQEGEEMGVFRKEISSEINEFVIPLLDKKDQVLFLSGYVKPVNIFVYYITKLKTYWKYRKEKRG